MAEGTVKWFNSTKGYGFIAPNDGGKDIFLHISAVERAGIQRLDDGQKVTKITHHKENIVFIKPCNASGSIRCGLKRLKCGF